MMVSPEPELMTASGLGELKVSQGKHLGLASCCRPVDFQYIVSTPSCDKTRSKNLNYLTCGEVGQICVCFSMISRALGST